jgi:Fe2+ or Zn2+ uptake regulation protein
MATRDKYNFTQQTDLWGVIKYADVPSYSSTSVGSTGNAYLVRNFLKKFFPFLDCTVNKTSGGSVNVKIQKFLVTFTFTEAGVAKQFILGPRSLEDILEPLFEGQGFDGMTDSTYSIPLPKMYNDDGQDVSYGYGYLFVGKGNIDGYYEVDLDQPTVKSGVTKFKFLNSPLSSVSLKENLQEIPQKTIEYIKLGAVVNTNAASPTNNESDLYILERGEENENTTQNVESLTTLEQEIIDFLAEKQKENVLINLAEIGSEFQNRNYQRPDMNNAMSNLLIADLLDTKSGINDVFYFPSAKGYEYVTRKTSLLDSTNKSTLTSGDIAAIEFITQNYTILKDMEKESPELYNGISEGLRLIMSLTKDGTGKLEPFKPLENQQQLVDQLKEDDFDLSEVDLEEIDLTGFEDDLELNDDELGDVNLTEFNELSDFVESELMPSPSQNDRLYAILKTVELMQLTNKKFISTKKILESVNFNNQQKYTLQEIDVLEDNGFMERSSNGIFLSTKGQDFINEYELKNKQVPPSSILTLTQLYILELLSKKTTVDGIRKLYKNELVKMSSSAYDEDMIDDILRVLIDLKYVNEVQITNTSYQYHITELGFNYLNPNPMAAPQAVLPPVDIENLDALQKNILMILDKLPAYNKMDQSEIWAEVDDTIANEYVRDDVKTALDVLIGLKLVVAKKFPVEYRLSDDKRTSETIANIKNELSPLTPTVEKILRILYRFTGKLSADNIKDDLSNVNIILPHKAIFSRLIALRDRGLVREINTSYGGIVWQITPLGNEYVDKLPKEKTGGQIREEEKQAKIEKDFGSLDYDFYLVLKILNDNMGMITAGDVTAILQQQFNKKPKWDEFAVYNKLQGLLSMGLALEDIQNSTEYFEMSAYGEDVFKYLSEQESIGLYPKSKPTEQTVAVRPSPTESATLNSVGTIKKGNDGNNWEVKESSKGVKRWVKIK